jgi:hypothetical protein
MQSVPITTIVMSSILACGEVYSIKQYVVKFVSDLRHGQSFAPCTPVSSTNKTDHHVTI